jgi:hypothetical protein
MGDTMSPAISWRNQVVNGEDLYLQFRELYHETAEYANRTNSWQSAPLTRCYNSYEVFDSLYPSLHDKARLVAEVEARQKERDGAIVEISSRLRLNGILAWSDDSLTFPTTEPTDLIDGPGDAWSPLTPGS